MDLKKLTATLTLSLTLSACSTAPKSLVMGAIAGGVVGAGLGQARSHDAEGTTVGSLVGAGIGSLIGYLSYNDQKKKNTEKMENPEEIVPFLTKPKVRSYMVPDTIEGNKYIKSHRIFILEDPGSWSK